MAVALVMVMILAALIALFIVLIVAVLVGQSPAAGRTKAAPETRAFAGWR